MRTCTLSMCIATVALCLGCSRASAQGAVISGDVSGSKVLDQTNFNFDNTGLGDASAEGVTAAVPPDSAGSSAESRGANNLGTITQLPGEPAGPLPPMPPPAPPYLAGLGSYGSSAADVGAYPGVLNIAARAAALDLPQVLNLVGGGSAAAAGNGLATINGTAASRKSTAASDNTAAGVEGSVSSPINEPAPSSTDTRPDFPPGSATGAGTTEPSEGTTTVQLGVSSGGNAAERRSTLQAAALMAAAAAAATLLLSAL